MTAADLFYHFARRLYFILLAIRRQGIAITLREDSAAAAIRWAMQKHFYSERQRERLSVAATISIFRACADTISAPESAFNACCTAAIIYSDGAPLTYYSSTRQPANT